MVDWATKSNLALLHNPKDAPRFFCGRWNTGTNPDLAFAGNGLVCWQLDRRILEKLLRSQHRPSLIKSSKAIVSHPSEPYKRWNFRKTNGKSTRASPTRLLGTFHFRTLPVLMKPTKTSATPSPTQQKNQFYAVVGKTTDHAGMRSARPSTRVTTYFFGHRRAKALTQLPLPCLPDLIKGEGNTGHRQSMPSTLRTPAGWRGML